MTKGIHVVEDYRFGHVKIDGQPYGRDVIVLPDRVIANWWRREGHRVYPEDLEDVFGAAPEVLVVGQGMPGRMRVNPETERALHAAGIELVVLPTKEACRVYGELAAQKVAAAALHLSC